jgi:hypothetical protein
MQIIHDPRLTGGTFVPPRTSFEALYSTPPSKPLQLRKLRIIEPCGVRGHFCYPGTVLAFDIALPDYREDHSLLRSCLKAETVDVSTPLHVAPAAPPPQPAPAKQETPTMAELIRALTSALKASKA